MFGRLISAYKTSKLSWQITPCPSCESINNNIILKYDRYLQKVDICICSTCGLVYTSRNLSKESLTTFYNHYYRSLYESVSAVTDKYIYNSKDKLKAAYRLVRIKEHISEISGILEIGSGLGFFIYECLNSGIDNVIGFELGNVFHEFASEKLGLGNKIINIDPLEYSGSFSNINVVVLFHVLEHLDNPGLLLQWVKSKVDNSILVIEVPDIEHGWEETGLINFHFGHRSYFSIHSLSNLLASHGFSITTTQLEESDGIYPGNLRVFAKQTDNSVTINHPSSDWIDQIAKKISNINLWSLKTGYPRSALRLLRP